MKETLRIFLLSCKCDALFRNSVLSSFQTIILYFFSTKRNVFEFFFLICSLIQSALPYGFLSYSKMFIFPFISLLVFMSLPFCKGILRHFEKTCLRVLETTFLRNPSAPFSNSLIQSCFVSLFKDIFPLGKIFNHIFWLDIFIWRLLW